MSHPVTVPAAGPDPNARGAAWHHPNFRGYQRHDYGGDRGYSEQWAIAPFTGTEPDPETVMPDHVQALSNGDWDSPGYRAYRLIVSELRVANTFWQVARWTNAAAIAIREGYPTYRAYAAAIAAAAAAYAALDTTPDGQWRAALLRLTDVRRIAIEAAANMDGANAEIEALTEDLPERVTEELPALDDIAKKLGLDVTGWEFYTNGGLTYDLERTFREQDERIAAVARLAGEPADR